MIKKYQYTPIPGSLNDEPKALLIDLFGKGDSDAVPWFPIQNAIVDTGASFSAVPEAIVSFFQIFSQEKKYVRGIDNTSTLRTFYTIQVKLGEKEILTEACVVNFPLFIIGRDLLQELILTANGKAQEFIIEIAGAGGE